MQMHSLTYTHTHSHSHSHITRTHYAHTLKCIHKYTHTHTLYAHKDTYCLFNMDYLLIHTCIHTHKHTRKNICFGAKSGCKPSLFIHCTLFVSLGAGVSADEQFLYKIIHRYGIYIETNDIHSKTAY